MADEIPQHILQAIEKGDLPAVKTWLGEDKSNLYKRKNNGETLLHPASYYGQLEIIKFLVAEGLSIDVKDQSGFSVLHEAARNNQAEAARVLLELGADPDAKLNNGTSIEDNVKDKNSKAIPDLLFAARNKPRWLKTGPEEVSYINYRHEIGYRLTEIFNFRSRTYVLLSKNQQTSAESAVHKTFSDFGDREPILQAQKEFERLGGTLPDAYEKLDKPKKTGLSSRNLG